MWLLQKNPEANISAGMQAGKFGATGKVVKVEKIGKASGFYPYTPKKSSC